MLFKKKEKQNLLNYYRTKSLLDKFPNFDPTWTDNIKTKWLECFCDLIDSLPGPYRR